MSNAVTTKLESRIARLVDAAADRRPVTLLRAGAGVAVAFALLVPIAAVKAERTFAGRPNSAIAEHATQPSLSVATPSPSKTPSVGITPPRAIHIAQAHVPQTAQIAQAAQIAQSATVASLAGVVHDPSGAIVPGVAIFLLNSDSSGTTNSTFSNAAGQWAFSGLAAGTKYVIEVRAPGFKVWRGTVSAGSGIPINSNLTLGEVSEAVTVVAGRVAAPIPLAAASGPVRVGGNVQAARLINAVKPIFPPSLRDLGIEGVVQFQAIISKTGQILDPRPLPGNAAPELVQAALDAIRLWQYEPTRLNGEPVEVLTKIDVAFQLQ